MTTVARTPATPATLDDLLAIPDERRHHEIIDGELVEKGAATGEHGRAQIALGSTLLHRFDRRPGGRWPGGWWFATEVEIFFADTQIYRPDVVGWSRERAASPPAGTPIELLPDWICEILSTNRRNDLLLKKRRYHQHKIPHYWIVDPSEQTLAVHRWAPDGYIELLAAERGETVRAEPFDAVDFFVGVLFGDDEPPPSAR
jgi:Uma2 family endonuclease